MEKKAMKLGWITLMLCTLCLLAPPALRAQAHNYAMTGEARKTVSESTPGKIVASVAAADLPTEKVAQYRRGRKAAQTDTVRFTAVWAADPENAYPMQMMLAGEGEGVIDWGDGTQSTCSAAMNEAGTDYAFAYYEHLYTEDAENGGYDVTVYTSSPDLQIVGLQLYYYTNYDEYTLHKNVNVTSCPSLKYLYCDANWLESLDVSRNAALERLNCTYCRLTSLALPQNTSSLKVLACGGNKLTSLEVSGCTALRELYCWGNQLTSLDVSNNPVLDTLGCSSNQFGWATLDALSKLNCSYLSIAPQQLSFEVGLNEAVDLSAYMTYNGQQTVCDFSVMPSAYTFQNGVLKINRAGVFTVPMSNPIVKRNGESLLINSKISVKSGVSDTVSWVWQQSGGIEYVNLTIAGNATSIFMDWGDGQISTEEVNANGFRQIRHIYDEAGEYAVKIWGNNQWVLSGLELFGHSHVQSLDVSDCPYLESLTCTGNDLTALDLSGCRGLKSLNCYLNQLSSLDVTKNMALTQLYCHGNQLTALDVTKNVNLVELNCSSNQLTSLDVTKNVNLKSLNCSQNQLSSLNVMQNTALTTLACTYNQLGVLDVAKNTALKELRCYDNQLSSLDVTKNTALEIFDCGSNRLTELNVAQNTALRELECPYNQLISLDVSQNVNLERLNCLANLLTSLNTGGHTWFEVLYCSHNQLGWAALDALSKLGDNVNLSPQQLPLLEVGLNEAVDLSAYMTYNGQQTVFVVTPESGYTLANGVLRLQNTGAYTVKMSNPAVTLGGESVFINRDVAAWPAVSDTLRCVVLDSTGLISYRAICDSPFVVDWGDGQKDTVTVSGQSYSEAITHSYGAVGEYAITVYGLKRFMLLDLVLGSNVQSLDVRACPFLEDLRCEYHQLTELDLSNNTNLTDLYVNGNRLTSLDLSNNTNLTDLYVNDNRLTSLDLSNNTALRVLCCAHNQLSSLNVSQNVTFGYMDCENNRLGWADLDALSKLKGHVYISPQRLSLEVGFKEDVFPAEYLTYSGQQTVFHLDDISSSYYTLENGNLQFNTFGTLNCSISNPAVKTKDGASVSINCEVSVWPEGSDTVRWVWQTDGGIAYVNLERSDEDGFMINWGDGTVEKIDKSANWYQYQFSHTYATAGEYAVTVYGIKHLVLLGLELFSEPLVKSVDVSACPYLESLSIYSGGLTSLDVSKNTSLKSLLCSFSQLTTLDVSKNTALTGLSCNGNQLTSLDVSKNTALQSLNCSDNQLTSLDVSKNTALTLLDCGSNQLSSLDVSKNTALTFLNCNVNQLTSVDVSKHTALTILYCDGNQLSSLDVSKNTALTSLYCAHNQLTSLDVSKNTALTSLNCGPNQLTSLDVSKNTALTSLYCPSNQLTSLDVSKNTALTSLTCASNQLTSLDLTKNTALEVWDASDNVRIVELDEDRVFDMSTLPGMDLSRVSNMTDAIFLNPQVIFRSENVTYDYATGQGTVKFCLKEAIVRDTIYMTWTAEAGQEKTLTVGIGEEDNEGHPYWVDYGDGEFDHFGVFESTAATVSHIYKTSGTYNVKVSLASDARIRTFSCDGLSRKTGNGVTSLDVSACSELETLSCNNNSLTALDLSQNTALTSLSCNYNPALVLDLSQIPSLTYLSCNGNRWSSLDVSQLPDLMELWCADNQLTSLNLSQNTALRTLYCHNNQLLSLNISSNLLLKVLSCSFNKLTSLDLSKNTRLETLYCTDNQLTSLDRTANVSLNTLQCDNNYRVVSLDALRRVDLKNLPGMDVSRIRNVKGGTLEGSRLTFNTGVEKVTYDYATRVNDDASLPLRCEDEWNNIKAEMGEGFAGLSEEDKAEMEAAFKESCEEQDLPGDFDFRQFSIGTSPLSEDPGTMPRDTIYMVVANEGYGTNVSFGVNVSVPAHWTSGQTVWVDWGNGIRSYSSKTSESFSMSFPGEGVYEVMVSVASSDVRLTGMNLSYNQRWAVLRSLDVSACPSLESLSCYRLSPSLNLSNNPALKYLYWVNNDWTHYLLDLRSCVALEELNCEGSSMVYLYLPNSSALKKLNCTNTLLTSLDVSKNTGLTELRISSCYNLQSLDLTHNSALKEVYCDNNAMEYNPFYSLDVRGCTALEVLSCANNSLAELDLTQNRALKSLQCHNNRLKSLDVSKSTALKTLSCGNNQLTALDVSKNMLLESLSCNNNLLPALDVTKNTVLTTLECNDNHLAALDVSKNTALRSLNCANNFLTSLDLSKNPDLNSFNGNGNSRKVGVDENRGFDLSTLPGMEVSRVSNVDGGFKAGSRLYFDEDADEVTYDYNTKHSGNYKTVEFRLIAAPVTHDTVYLTWTAKAGVEKTLQVGIAEAGNWLFGEFGVDWGDGTYLYAMTQKDTSFTKTYATAGTYAVKVWTSSPLRFGTFGCSNSGVTALDVSACTELVSLACDTNQLTVLDLSGNTKLETLYCQNNQLKDLNLDGNTKLKALYCQNNQLTFNTISAFPIYYGGYYEIIEGRLSPQSDFHYTITMEEGFPLPERMEVDGEATVINVYPDRDYTIRDGRIFFDKASTYQLSIYNMMVACRYSDEEGTSWGVYYENSFVTVTGGGSDTIPGGLDTIPGGGPDTIPGVVSGQDLAVWTWTKAGDEAWETSVSFAGTEGGSFVIDWGDGVQATVEGTGELVKYAHTYGKANPVGPADTVFVPDPVGPADTVFVPDPVGPADTVFVPDPVSPADTLFRSGRKGLIEWRLYATTPESHILQLQKVSEVGLANETLDVSTCPELTYLAWVGCEDCGGGLTALDVSQNVKLERLYCYDNRLTSLDVTKNTALTLLSCHKNQLTALDVTKNTALTILSGAENRFTSLDVTKNVALFNLSCSGNQLTQLDVTKNVDLAYLYCHENRLESLDVTKNTKLETLYCYDNRLTALDVTANTALLHLLCGGNRLISLDVSRNTALEVLNCYDDQLTSLDVSRNTALTLLVGSANRLTSLDLTQNLMLETLYCSGNRLTSLDVSQNTALTWLSCDHNQLTSLDVSDCKALEVLFCDNNQFTSLDVTQNTALLTVQCDSNYLPLSVLASIKAKEVTCLSPQRIACETQPGKVLDLCSEMRIGATQTAFTMMKDGKPVDTTVYTMNADGVYGQLRFKSPGQYRLSLSNAEVTETYTLSLSGIGIIPNETPQPVYVYYDFTVEQPIVQGSGAGWMWLASAGDEKQITFEGSAKGFRIDWGDDATSDVESGLATHRYADGGIYTVKIESLSDEGRLTELNVSDGNVAMMWFEDASKLTGLNVSGNQLTSLDLSAAPNLKDYNCARNLFASLDLTAMAQLQTVDFSGNHLETVSLPTHSNLKTVKGADNRMKLSTLYGLLSQRVEKASYGFDPQGDSVYLAVNGMLDLSSEMNIGGNNTTYVIYDADGRPVPESEYTETNGIFQFTEAGRRYKLSLMNMGVMEYQNGNPQKPVTFVWNIIVPGVANEELSGSDAFVYVRNRTICLSEDLGEMRVFTALGRCIYKGNGLEAEVPCAGLYIVQAGGHTWKVVVR